MNVWGVFLAFSLSICPCQLFFSSQAGLVPSKRISACFCLSFVFFLLPSHVVNPLSCYCLCMLLFLPAVYNTNKLTYLKNKNALGAFLRGFFCEHVTQQSDMQLCWVTLYMLCGCANFTVGSIEYSQCSVIYSFFKIIAALHEL